MAQVGWGWNTRIARTALPGKGWDEAAGDSMALREAAAPQNMGTTLSGKILSFPPSLSCPAHLGPHPGALPPSAGPPPRTRRPGPWVSSCNPGSGVGARVPGQTARSQLALPLSSCGSTCPNRLPHPCPPRYTRMNWHLPAGSGGVSDGTDAGNLALGWAGPHSFAASEANLGCPPLRTRIACLVLVQLALS